MLFKVCTFFMPPPFIMGGGGHIASPLFDFYKSNLNKIVMSFFLVILLIIHLMFCMLLKSGNEVMGKFT